MTHPNEYDREVIAEWEAAGASDRRMAHIHPSGLRHPSEYSESGEIAAMMISSLLASVHVDLRGSRLLDYGCGDGRVSVPLAHRGAKVTALDASPSMLAALDYRAEPDIATIIPSQFPHSGPYDAAICLAVLIHQRWAAAAEIVDRIATELAPGGAAVVDAPCYEVEEEGGSAFAVTTFSPKRIRGMADDSGLLLGAPLVVNRGKYGGVPAPNHGAWTLLVRPG